MNGHIGNEEVELLVRGAVEEKTCCKGRISELLLNNNNITFEGVKHMSSFPKQFINKLETLNLSVNNLDSRSCTVLAHLIPHVPNLTKLNLSWKSNILGPGGAVPLITSMTAHSSLKLQLYETGIGVKDCQALKELLSSSTSLKNLDIGYNDLPPEAIELIISGLHHNTTLQRLDMHGSNSSLQNIKSLASALRTNHTLVDLDLAQCNIESGGARQLASALCTNDTLQVLWLSGNPIGVEGATAFSEMLPKNKALKELNLQDNSIGKEGTQKLIHSLTHNAKVEKLWLPEVYKSSVSSSRVDSRVLFDST